MLRNRFRWQRSDTISIEPSRTGRSARADSPLLTSLRLLTARNSADILREILDECGVDTRVGEEICRLVRAHETGGDERSDLLKNADSLSYFDVNLPFYVKRHTWEETKWRSMWGFKRLSPESQARVKGFRFTDGRLNELIREVAAKANPRE